MARTAPIYRVHKKAFFVFTPTYVVSPALSNIGGHLGIWRMDKSMRYEQYWPHRANGILHDYKRLLRIYPEYAIWEAITPLATMLRKWHIGICRNAHPGITSKDVSQQQVCTGSEGTLRKPNERGTDVQDTSWCNASLVLENWAVLLESLLMFQLIA